MSRLRTHPRYPAGHGAEGPDQRSGFTMIEAIMVVSIVIILTSITVPGSVSALRAGRVNQAVSILDTANSDAQRFSRAGDASDPNNYYGVRLEGGQPPHRISVIYGNTTSAPAISGLTRSLNPNVLIYNGDSPLSGSVVWFYQGATGFPIAANNLNGPTIAVGTPSSPVTTDLSIRSSDGQFNTRIQIFEVGLMNRERAND